MVFGDNNLNPSEWIKKWKDKYGGGGNSDSTTGGMTSAQQAKSVTIKTGYLASSQTYGDWSDWLQKAIDAGIGDWFKDNYSQPGND
jgi:hypothetical protein